MSSIPIRTRERGKQQVEDFAIFEGVPMPLLLLDTTLHVFRMNNAFVETYGRHDDFAARPFPAVARMRWGMKGLQLPLAAIADGRRADFRMEHVLAQPERRALRLTARMVFGGTERLMVVALEDITFTRFAQKRLEEDNTRLQHQFDLVSQALHRTKQDLENLAGRLLSAQEEERRRLARELHDDLSQQVAILRMDSERMAKQIPEAPRAVGVYLRNLRKQTQKLARDLRRVAHQLHPSILEHLGLPTALESLVREFGEREETAVRFESKGVWDGLGREVGTAVYRISQEALRNISKHAGPTDVDVQLTAEADHMTLVIRDYGAGFDASDPRCIGLGLVSMQERAWLAGGALEIWSERGHGTRLTVTLPTRVKEP